MQPYYESGGITIYLGDCRDVLPTLGQVDHCITDPPYSEVTHIGARSETPGWGPSHDLLTPEPYTVRPPDGVPVVVSRPAVGEVKAFTAICTHMGCTVNPAGTEFHCPCHGSKYDAFTGSVITGPAPAPLKSIAVTVQAARSTAPSVPERW